jgi:hypothetical protein
MAMPIAASRLLRSQVLSQYPLVMRKALHPILQDVRFRIRCRKQLHVGDIVVVSREELEEFPAFVPPKNKTLTKKQIDAAKLAILHQQEENSVTAEFTPRVRLTHPKLSRATFQPLIDVAPEDALLVRVTGLLLFDSEHAQRGRELKRHNNWEIHPY